MILINWWWSAIGIELLCRHDQGQDINASSNPAVVCILKQRIRTLVIIDSREKVKSLRMIDYSPGCKPDQQQHRTLEESYNALRVANPQSMQHYECNRIHPWAPKNN